MKKSLVSLLLSLVLLTGCADQSVEVIKRHHEAIRKKDFKLFLSTLSESKRDFYSNPISYHSFMSLPDIYLKKVVRKEKYDGRMEIETIEITKENSEEQEFRKIYWLVKENGKWKISHFGLE